MSNYMTTQMMDMYDTETKKFRRVLFEMNVENDKIFRALALRAFKNKNGKATALGGGIKVNVLDAG
jgi:hypothetical protein